MEQKKVNKNNEQNKKEEKKNNRKWLLLLLLLLFLSVFGVVIFKIGFDFGTAHHPVTPEPTPKKFLIKISDEDGDWEKSETLNVFSVNERDVIAPYDRGSYEFEIQNTRNKSISYTLSLSEENPYKVNIKYRLKENGKYIIGGTNWEYYDKIQLKDISLSANESDKYELEWMWVSEDNEADTNIGLMHGVDYNLTFKVVAIELEG